MSFLKNIFKQKKILITHNGTFHADDLFATATLSILNNGNIKVVRTRDPEMFEKGDYVYDVGGIYDPEKNKFDHHQKGFDEKRENGIIYSSFGLVWKKFGLQLTGSEKAMLSIDKHLVAPIDAGDNGIDLVENKYDISQYLIQDFFRIIRPTWRETDAGIDINFLRGVEIAKEILLREITYAKDAILADEAILSIYQNTKDKRVIILDKNYAKKEILEKLIETIYVVYPRETDHSWGVEAIRKDFRSFENKKNLPNAWGGLRDKELQNITGVSDAVFCHKALFMIVSKSKEGAIKLAEKALLA